MKETSAEKYPTSELLKQKILAASGNKENNKEKIVTEAVESESVVDLIDEVVVTKKGGKWKGVENSYSLKNTVNTQSTITTLKATLAHKECSSNVNQYNQVDTFIYLFSMTPFKHLTGSLLFKYPRNTRNLWKRI